MSGETLTPGAQFYFVALGNEEYEVEAFSEEQAWQRALAEHSRKLVEQGLTVLATKLADL